MIIASNLSRNRHIPLLCMQYKSLLIFLICTCTCSGYLDLFILEGSGEKKYKEALHFQYLNFMYEKGSTMDTVSMLVAFMLN